MKKNHLILLILILALFLFTRLFLITTNPPSLYWDEASIGYNAYSIITTGKDEWGSPFPVHFRAFGEFKLPIYIYTVSVFEYFLGLTELSVRLPAVIYGFGVIILIYLIGKKLFTEEVGILSALILVALPWYFLISRVGYEANAGLMFFLLGLYLWLIKDKRQWYLLISTISFILSVYSYNSFRVVVPLTILYLLIFHFNWKETLKKNIGLLLISGLILLASFLQIIRFTLLTSGTNRLNTIGIFQGTILETILSFTRNYLSHFSPDFLFTSGDMNLRSHIGYGGEIYLIFLPFLLLGLWYLHKKKRYLPLILILISIIPAALTRESPHVLRTISLVPFLSIIIAGGIFWLSQQFKKWNLFYYLLIYSAIFISFGLFFRYFILEYPLKSGGEWQYNYKQIFTANPDNFKNYDQVVISDSGAQPYIFGLFYLKYDPDKFRESVKYNPPDKWGFSTVESFDRFIFKDNLLKLPGEKVLNISYEY